MKLIKKSFDNDNDSNIDDNKKFMNDVKEIKEMVDKMYIIQEEYQKYALEILNPITKKGGIKSVRSLSETVLSFLKDIKE